MSLTDLIVKCMTELSAAGNSTVCLVC